MKLWQIVTVCSVLTLSLADCSDGAGGAGPSGGGSYGSGTASDAQMSGAMGNVHQFASDAVGTRIYGGDTTVQLDAVNTEAQWWVMTRLTFSRPLSDAAWAPGMVRTFESFTPQPDGLSVHAVGCSGPSLGHYTYDGGPDRVLVHVLPGTTPTGKVFSFAAYWDRSNQVVTGTFAYDLG